jgi:hypothetical protein
MIPVAGLDLWRIGQCFRSLMIEKSLPRAAEETGAATSDRSRFADTRATGPRVLNKRGRQRRLADFTPIDLALTVPLENRFPFSPPDPQVPPDGIVILAGGAAMRLVSTLSQNYPRVRLIFCGFSAINKNSIKRLAELGVDPSRINTEQAAGMRLE